MTSRATGEGRDDINGDGLGHLADALRKQWKSYRKDLKRCQDRFSEEAIHDSRVGTRRLEATLELLGGFLPAALLEKIARALKEHLDSFDDLRDTQVQMDLVGKMERKFAAARKFQAFLGKREARVARRTRKRIRKARTGKLAKLIQQGLREVEKLWRACPPEKANDRLSRAIGRGFARVQRLRSRIDPRDTQTIHSTRVAFKRFRYMVEALADCHPRADEHRLAAMRRYQAMMGDIQDAQVLLAAADKYLRKHEVGAQAAWRFREELLRRREALIRRYMDAAGELSGFWQI